MLKSMTRDSCISCVWWLGFHSMKAEKSKTKPNTSKNHTKHWRPLGGWTVFMLNIKQEPAGLGQRNKQINVTVFRMQPFNLYVEGKKAFEESTEASLCWWCSTKDCIKNLWCFLIMLEISSHWCVHFLLALDHPKSHLTWSLFSCSLFPPLPQMYGGWVFVFLLSVQRGIQLGKCSVYNTLCLQLTFLINCNRNTAISSLIAGRIQLYISSLSRIQKLRLPNFQRERIGRESFYVRITGEGELRNM